MANPVTLTVGPDQQYHTIAAAITAANSIFGGVVIQVTAGTYVNDGGLIANNNVVIEGVGGVAKLVGASKGSGGAAALAVSGINIFLANLDISGVANGAGILDEPYHISSFNNIFINSVHVHDNQVGIAAPDNSDGTLTILDSEIDHNGRNVDAGAIQSVEIESSSIHDAQGSDEVRSLAQQSFIFQDVIADNASNAAYGINLPNATFLSVGLSTIEKGPNSSTDSMIFRGTKPPDDGMLFDKNTLVNDVFPNTDKLFGNPVGSLRSYDANLTWNLPNPGGGILARSNHFQALKTRPILQTPPLLGSVPTIATVRGNHDGGVTIVGTFQAGGTVTVADTVRGKATLLDSAVAGSNGKFSLTTHAKISTTTVNSYTVSGTDPFGHVASMPGALFLTDTGADHLSSAPGVANVFAVMSFKGSEVIDAFKTTSASGALHDVLNFSGRGITSFAQVQAMMSGSASTILTMSSGKTITLEGVSPTTLSATDFAYS